MVKVKHAEGATIEFDKIEVPPGCGFCCIPCCKIDADPTDTPEEGSLRIQHRTSDDTYRLWAYLNGAWRSVELT